MRAPEQPKDSYPETRTKSFEKQTFWSFLELRRAWSISGSREQCNLAQTIDKPIENQMRPEDNNYKTQKPYMRVVKTNKIKENPNETKEKPKSTIEQNNDLWSNLAKAIVKQKQT